MLIPNRRGHLARLIGRNRHAEAVFAAPVEVDCAIVRLNAAAQKTSVRSDSSASRGNAEESVSDAKILFPARVRVAIGDHFVIDGQTLVVTAAEPRYAVTGRFDHTECDFARFGG